MDIVSGDCNITCRTSSRALVACHRLDRSVPSFGRIGIGRKWAHSSALAPCIVNYPKISSVWVGAESVFISLTSRTVCTGNIAFNTSRITQLALGHMIIGIGCEQRVVFVLTHRTVLRTDSLADPLEIPICAAGAIGT